jgi:HEAT repeat protein
LRILEDIADREQALELIDELLADEAPGYTKDTSKRLQLIGWLSEWPKGSDDDAVSRTTPYLADFDENVRFAAVEALSLRCTEDAAEPLVSALLNDKEESGRLKARIVEVLHEKQLPLGERKKQVGKLLPDIDGEFRLQRDKVVRKKKPK